MAKDLVPAQDIKEICEQIIAKYPVNYGHINIEKIYFRRDLAKKGGTKPAYAYVKKIADLDKDLIPNFDYYFVINDYIAKDLNPAQLNILCMHELKHIGGSEVDEDGNETVKIIPHDLEEFYDIVAVFGIDWTTNDTVRDPLKEIIELPQKPKKEKSNTEQDLNQQFV